jgi:hypothetical protein
MLGVALLAMWCLSSVSCLRVPQPGACAFTCGAHLSRCSPRILCSSPSRPTASHPRKPPSTASSSSSGGAVLLASCAPCHCTAAPRASRLPPGALPWCPCGACGARRARTCFPTATCTRARDTFTPDCGRVSGLLSSPVPYPAMPLSLDPPPPNRPQEVAVWLGPQERGRHRGGGRQQGSRSRQCGKLAAPDVEGVMSHELSFMN